MAIINPEKHYKMLQATIGKQDEFAGQWMWFDGISYHCRKCQEILPWKYPYMPDECPECGFKGEPKLRTVALIPARGGSQRIRFKNIELINSFPMIAWSIFAAKESCCFDEIWCSTNSSKIARIANQYGANVIMRPDKISQNDSPDYLWVEHFFSSNTSNNITFDIFSILRPTSPFRTADTIRRAFIDFFMHQPADSLRAVEKCKQHPAKMWTIRFDVDNRRWLQPHNWEYGACALYSRPTQSAPLVFVQNASLEIAWVDMFKRTGDIAGNDIIPFFTQGYEGFDINTPDDLLLAETLLRTQKVILPFPNLNL